MDDTGEPLIGNGDFLFTQETDEVLQNVMFRLKTVQGDFIIFPECGASLESAVGEPNSEATASLIEDLITQALTHDGYVATGDLMITTYPINTTTIMSVVEVEVNGVPVTRAVSIDLREGLISYIEV